MTRNRPPSSCAAHAATTCPARCTAAPRYRVVLTMGRADYPPPRVGRYFAAAAYGRCAHRSIARATPCRATAMAVVRAARPFQLAAATGSSVLAERYQRHAAKSPITTAAACKPIETHCPTSCQFMPSRPGRRCPWTRRLSRPSRSYAGRGPLLVVGERVHRAAGASPVRRLPDAGHGDRSAGAPGRPPGHDLPRRADRVTRGVGIRQESQGWNGRTN
jgi:hypothetical protein